jgi:hypothetical protein
MGGQACREVAVCTCTPSLVWLLLIVSGCQRTQMSWWGFVALPWLLNTLGHHQSKPCAVVKLDC